VNKSLFYKHDNNYDPLNLSISNKEYSNASLDNKEKRNRSYSDFNQQAQFSSNQNNTSMNYGNNHKNSNSKNLNYSGYSTHENVPYNINSKKYNKNIASTPETPVKKHNVNGKI
jgi:hypothetical protein